MKKSLIYFADYRGHLDDPNTLIIHAGTNESFMDGAQVIATIDGKEVPVQSVIRDNNRARFCYRGENLLFSWEFQFLIQVPDTFSKCNLTVKFTKKYDNAVASFSVSGKQFARTKSKISGCVDTVKKMDDVTKIAGWCADRLPVTVRAMKDGMDVPCEINRLVRTDIDDYYLEDEFKGSAGFEITLDGYQYKTIDIVFETTERSTTKTVNIDKDQEREQMSFGEALRVSFDYLRQRGIKAFYYKILKKVFGVNVFDYDRWIHERQATDKELKEQMSYQFASEPLFSIVVPVFRPKAEYFEAMIRSVLAQTYGNFELCLADGSGDGHTMEKTVQLTAKNDPRVKYCKLGENLGISGNTNAALELATGDFIVLGDHDDLLRPDALFECAKALEKDPTIDIIYTDEDKYDTGKKRRILPHFKPDFNLDMLRNNNYICHLFVFSKEIYRKVGNFRSEFDGSQDYDMILRCTEQAKHIHHIPKVLYTWRSHENSTAKDPASKNYAFVAGLKAVEAHLDRVGVKAKVTPTETPGYNRIEYEILGEPKISIIIPSKDHIDDLDKCLKSIIGRQDYTNYEIIIVENNSEEDRTFAYYDRIEADHECVRVVYWNGTEVVSRQEAVRGAVEFNYSKINNAGVSVAEGEYILLLNNDTEMIRKNCLRELISFGTRPEVGIVGARLYYNDNTLQHGGVIIGLGGVAGHAFAGIPKDFSGYFARAVIPQNYSAVTAACLLVRTSVFHEVGGLEPDLKVAFNDVDFCLKVRDAGYLIVYNPAAELYHYESKSRGFEDTPEKVERFKNEVDYITTKWRSILDQGDPYYNINLSLTRADFAPKE